MRDIVIRTGESATVTARVESGETFGQVILKTGYRAEMGKTYALKANVSGDANFVPVRVVAVIPDTVTEIQIESCAKC